MKKKSSFFENELVRKILESKRIIKRFFLFLLILISESVLLISLIEFKRIDLSKLYIIRGKWILNSIYLFILTFLILLPKTFKNIKLPDSQNYKRFVPLFFINLLSVFMFYKLNKYFINNISIVYQNAIYYSFLWWVLPIVIFFSLLFAFFDSKYNIYLFKKIKNPLAISISLTFIFFFLSRLGQKLWPFLSRTVARTVYFLLNIFFNNVVLNKEKIGLSRFIVSIGAPCLGLEGTGLFLLLFTIFVLVQFDVLNKSKVIISYFCGAVGAFLMNIIRISSLIVVGHSISADFAIGAFHLNAGWILFTIYFLTFIYFAYPWMLKK